jgi:hypothetical protein
MPRVSKTQSTLESHVERCAQPPLILPHASNTRAAHRSIGVIAKQSAQWTTVAVQRHLSRHPDVPPRLLTIDAVAVHESRKTILTCTFLNFRREKCTVELPLISLAMHYPTELRDALDKTCKHLEALADPGAP